MNAKLFLLCFLSAATAYAADTPYAQFKSSILTPIPLDRTARLQEFLTAKANPSVIALGRSDFVLSGPLVAGLRPLPHQDNLSLRQKFLRLPVIRLFVPGPMTMPSETEGKYFAWRNEECTLSWDEASSRPPLAQGPE